MSGLQALQPAVQAWTALERGGPLGQLQERAGVAPPRLLGLAALLEPFRGVLPDRLEQAVAALLGLRVEDDQRPVEQALQVERHIGCGQTGPGCDAGGGLRVERAREN